MFPSTVISAFPLRCVLLVLLPTFNLQTSSDVFTVMVQSQVSGLLGSSVSLHCALDSTMDARTLTVRWYRPNMSNTPILFYENSQIQKNPVDDRYKERVRLLGELEKGNVSMKLEHLTLADRGDYVCHVSSKNWYDTATVSLSVRVIGSTPVLSTHKVEEGKMNFSCQSHDWLPEPSITWTNGGGRDLNHLRTDKFTNSSEGFVGVSSWLIVSPSESDWISCSVGLSDQERKESRVILDIPVGVTGFSNGYLIVILVLLLLCAAGIAVFCVLRKKGLILSKTKRTENTEGTSAVNEPLNEIHVEEPNPHSGVEDLISSKGQETEIPAGTPAESEPLNKNHEENPDQSDDLSSLMQQMTMNQSSKQMENLPSIPDLDRVKKFKVNITIDPSETPDLLTQEGNAVRCNSVQQFWNCDSDDDKIFTLCKERFTDQEVFWEVKVRESNVKLSWFIGVTSEAAEKWFSVPFTPQKEFWVLCFEKEKGLYIRDQHELTLLHGSEEPKAVGVFLDCKTHTLSFYNIHTKSHIYTFTNVKSNTSLCPLISPGVRDPFPVQVL